MWHLQKKVSLLEDQHEWDERVTELCSRLAKQAPEKVQAWTFKDRQALRETLRQKGEAWNLTESDVVLRLQGDWLYIWNKRKLGRQASIDSD